MRPMDPDARRLLGVATEVARVRHGDVCEPRDLVVAYVIHELIPSGESPTISAQNSTSPEQLRLSPEIEEVLTLETDEPVVLGEFLDLARQVGPELYEYLGVK
ncbi:hypothetical protein OG625_07800 [Streptomyces sp. NBC_01351]|uniref:hypothetical protein n=1 Tax=Streptomyces sp. NBC_01351 TaxID=2903833 RepID=UPI002E34F440|nr:hypothetical protein [Streptomyces sp. NBC_01351]